MFVFVYRHARNFHNPYNYTCSIRRYRHTHIHIYIYIYCNDMISQNLNLQKTLESPGTVNPRIPLWGEVDISVSVKWTLISMACPDPAPLISMLTQRCQTAANKNERLFQRTVALTLRVSMNICVRGEGGGIRHWPQVGWVFTSQCQGSHYSRCLTTKGVYKFCLVSVGRKCNTGIHRHRYQRVVSETALPVSGCCRARSLMYIYIYIYIYIYRERER